MRKIFGPLSAYQTGRRPREKPFRLSPSSQKKPLSEQAEYLVDTKTSPPSAIIQVHIAEFLAGIPWTPLRARQHVVNEISQTLHKVLIFNNNLSNPFQKWQHGNWFACWGEDAEGEHALWEPTNTKRSGLAGFCAKSGYFRVT